MEDSKRPMIPFESNGLGHGDHTYSPGRTTFRNSRRLRFILAVTIGLVFWCWISPAPGLQLPIGSLAPQTAISSPVPLDIHIMSKCPDALDCLRDLVVPTMQQVFDRVDFRLSYIGSVPKHEDTVECMHGPSECLGDILELCAAHVSPNPKLHLGFTMCMTDDYEHIPDESLVKDCALEHGIDFDKINECASKDDGSYGMDLLRSSVSHTQQVNVTKSCTVRLNDKIRCIRDGGRWTQCDGGYRPQDLVENIINATSN